MMESIGLAKSQERTLPPGLMQCHTSAPMPMESFPMLLEPPKPPKAEYSPKDFRVPKIVDGKVFVLQNHVGATVEARCMLCTVPKTIRGSCGASSNFLTHLKRVHPEYHVDHIKGRPAYLQSSSSQSETAPKRKRLDYAYSYVPVARTRTEQLVLDFIISSMSPVTIVEDPGFQGLIRGLAPETPLLTTELLQMKIMEQHSERQTWIANLLREVDSICVTADAWTLRRRRFLCVTAHWISEEFTRKSVALTFKRTTAGSHTWENIAQELIYTLDSYDIPQEKVAAIVTDNGEVLDRVFRDVQEDEDAVDNTIVDLERNDVSSILGEISDHDCMFPPFFNCPTNVLCNIANEEPSKIQESGVLNNILEKCTQLWNLLRTKTPDFLGNMGTFFSQPCQTRGGFEILNRIMELRPNLNQIMELSGVTMLDEKELAFLEEYDVAMKPLCGGLEILRLQENSFMGDFLPVLLQIRMILKNLTSSDQVPTNNEVAELLLEGLETRFSSYFSLTGFESKQFVLASIAHPFHKLRWIPLEDREKCKEIFLNECKGLARQSFPRDDENYDDVKPRVKQESSNEFNTSKEAFLAYDESEVSVVPSWEKKEYSIILECLTYLDDKSPDLQSLYKYPTVLRMFRKYNTAIPSSSPVERLLSQEGMILKLHRNSEQDDEIFEALALAKCN